MDKPRESKLAQLSPVDLGRHTLSRRGLLSGSAKLAAAGAVAAAFTSSLPFGVLAQEDSSGMPEDCLDIDGDGDIDEIDVLQYALTLEHLEANFYAGGLEAFSAADFQVAFRALRSGALDTSGMFIARGTTAHDFFMRIGGHESDHVDALTSVISDLGGEPVAAADYNFEAAFASVEAFVTTAQVLENTGVMAYDGAIHCLTTPDLMQAAATIATIEARHADYCDMITGNTPFPDSFDTPKTMSEILEIAGPFFAS